MRYIENTDMMYAIERTADFHREAEARRLAKLALKSRTPWYRRLGHLFHARTVEPQIEVRARTQDRYA